MKLLIVSALLLLLSSVAHAACPAMVRGALGPGKKSVAVSSQAYAMFNVLVSDYRERMEFSKPEITEVTARYRNGAISGYEVEITDGGDESTFRYVTDAKRRALVAYWYNQSPLTYWFCGTGNEVDFEETADGAEIF